MVVMQERVTRKREKLLQTFINVALSYNASVSFLLFGYFETVLCLKAFIAIQKQQRPLSGNGTENS